MFDNTKVTDALYGIVGLRQPFNPVFAILDAGNIASRSGEFITDQPMVKVDYLKDTQDFKDISDADFNEFLKQQQQSAIAQVCNSVFNESDYIDRQVFFKNANNKIDQDILADGFVGFRLQVTAKKNVAIKITRVLLEFATTGDLTLLLFNTARKDPIETQAITITDTQEVVELNWVIDNTDDYYKGDYYIGYIKDGTTPIPFKRQHDNANIISLVTYMRIWPIAVEGHTGTDIWDLDDEDGLSEDTGINPDVTVYEDFTDLIIQNEHLFAHAIYLAFSIKCLSIYEASLRSNRNERESQALVLRIVEQIEGQDDEQFQKVTGLRPLLFGNIKRIRNQIQKLHKGYMPSGPQVSTLN